MNAMLAANPYWENPRIYLAKSFVTFWEGRFEYISYILELFLDTVFPTPLPNFKSVALTTSSFNSEQTD